MKFNLTVNGREESVEAPAHSALLDILRDDLGLTGTKEGCREGECGACTVLVGGRAVDSCIYLAAAANGQQVETIEGIDAGVKAYVKDAMIQSQGVQCGFCTPGFVMMLTALLRKNPDPSEQEVKHALSGNICRCTGYSGIIAAARQAAEKILSAESERKDGDSA